MAGLSPRSLMPQSGCQHAKLHPLKRPKAAGAEGTPSVRLPVIRNADFASVSLARPLSLGSLMVISERDWESEYVSPSIGKQRSDRRLEIGSGLAQYFSTLATLTFGAG